MSMEELRAELKELQERRPELQEPEAFVLWFVMAQLGEGNIDVAANALTGGAGDKGVDAVYVDHDSSTVSIVQGKFSISGTTAEPLNDVLAHAGLASTLFDDDKYAAWRKNARPATEASLTAARKLLISRNYQLNLLYATTKRCTDTTEQQAAQVARGDRVSFTVFQRKHVERLVRDYLDGVAPPIPRVELPIETSPASGHIKRHDPKTEITSWIVSVRANEIAALYERHREKIFARNIRGYLGIQSNTVNSSIAHTLSTDPEHFWYFNNGITIVCDDARKIEQGGKDLLVIDNPQIVNGQQTTRTLAKAARADKAGVLVRVIALPRGELDLVGDIVKATNHQNPIRPSDLMANDRVQVFLERKLRLRGYQYLRKRGKKSDARAASIMKPKFQLSKEELAQAIAACEFDPAIVYSAKEKLFEEHTYARIFRREEVGFYLSRYWVVRLARFWGSGEGAEVARMKFFVVHAVWDRNGGVLSKYSDAFTRLSESSMGGAETPELDALDDSIIKTYDAVRRFYRKTKSKEDTPYSFWKRTKQYDAYKSFMLQSAQTVLRTQIVKLDDEVAKAFAP